ncbi:uncharacterized protein LOC131927092 [Physella acuta]|uniref:uncharacterized protein LOC131927092 n=1 Tax=Physella acuta TaxID=109671 RepID=UPI0027DCB26C|nr:uncharacterized protein LOC131927092 [Physella acuta]
MDTQMYLPQQLPQNTPNGTHPLVQRLPSYEQTQQLSPPTQTTPDPQSQHGFIMANGNPTSSETPSVPTPPSDKENSPGPFYVASVKAAPPSTYRPEPMHPRQNTLPGSLPTKLNASLQRSQFGQATPSSQLTTSSRTSTSRSSFDGTSNGEQLSPLTAGGSQSMVPQTDQVRSDGGQTGTQLDDNVVPNYQRPTNKDLCLRCNKKVYPVERVGPIKEVFYHKNCFTCVACRTLLHLKNFHHNPNDKDDLNVFCMSHKPRERLLSCDASAVHIKTALTAPKLDKVNEQIRKDRHPSEVLTRFPYTQPAASALVNTQDVVYYGMGSAQLSQIRHREEPQEPTLAASEPTQQQQMMPIHTPEHNNLAGDVPEENIDEYEIRELVRTSSKSSDSSKRNRLSDNVFDTVNSSSSVISSDADHSPGSSVSSHSSSYAPIKRKDRPSAESIATMMTSKLHIDQQETVEPQTGHKDPPLTRSDRPSSLNSRSSSPVVREGSRSNAASDSVRSSTSSLFSSHDSLDLESSLDRQKTLLGRSDRPSSNSSQEVSAREMSRMRAHSNEENKPQQQTTSVNHERHLPKNEAMRMDRPSQYH